LAAGGIVDHAVLFAQPGTHLRRGEVAHGLGGEDRCQEVRDDAEQAGIGAHDERVHRLPLGHRRGGHDDWCDDGVEPEMLGGRGIRPGERAAEVGRCRIQRIGAADDVDRPQLEAVAAAEPLIDRRLRPWQERYPDVALRVVHSIGPPGQALTGQELGRGMWAGLVPWRSFPSS
jgi:hypothetical protein